MGRGLAVRLWPTAEDLGRSRNVKGSSSWSLTQNHADPDYKESCSNLSAGSIELLPCTRMADTRQGRGSEIWQGTRSVGKLEGAKQQQRAQAR